MSVEEGVALGDDKRSEIQGLILAGGEMLPAIPGIRESREYKE